MVSNVFLTGSLKALTMLIVPTPGTPSVAPGTFMITTEGRNVKITGNGVVKTDTFKLPEGWYTRKLTYYGSTQAGRMDYFEADLVNSAGKKETGFIEQRKGTFFMYEGIHYPETTSSENIDTFYLQTLEPTAGTWVVEYIAPPEESSVGTAPVTLTGTGSARAGPVRLPARYAKATITYNGPAEQFHVYFNQQDSNYPQYPGFFTDLSQCNVDNLVDGKYAQSITLTADLDIFEPNLMLLMDVTAPAGSSWSITISPVDG